MIDRGWRRVLGSWCSDTRRSEGSIDCEGSRSRWSTTVPPAEGRRPWRGTTWRGGGSWTLPRARCGFAPVDPRRSLRRRRRQLMGGAVSRPPLAFVAASLGAAKDRRHGAGFHVDPGPKRRCVILADQAWARRGSAPPAARSPRTWGALGSPGARCVIDEGAGASSLLSWWRLRRELSELMVIFRLAP